MTHLIALGGRYDRQSIPVEPWRQIIDILHIDPQPIRWDVVPDDEIPVERITYRVQKVGAGEATMTARGRRSWHVLVPAGATQFEIDELWARDQKPIVDGGHRPGGMPGAGCTDPANIHRHLCASCSHFTWFSRRQCRQLAGVPTCENCHAADWLRDAHPDYLPELAGVTG